MGYKGTTIAIPCLGGWNSGYNVEAIPQDSLATSKNINIHNGGLEPRGGTAKYNSAAITSNPRVMGATQYFVASTKEIVAYTARGTSLKDVVFTVNTSGVDKTLFTCANGISKYPSFAVYNYKTYITNGADHIQVYAGGASTVSLTAAHGDWGANNQPIQLIKHGASNSERLWALAPTSLPGFVYFSQDNDGSTEAPFTGTGSGKFFIDTGDKFGIVGGVEYQDRLLLFGKKASYIIDDVSTDINDWGYTQAGWTGGASHFRVVVATPTDIYAMTDDGEIYSVTAAQSYGDYKSASIARPAGIHAWIKDNIDLTYINDFHAIYDYQLRAVKWYMVRNANSGHQVDTCLVYFVDRPPEKAWSLHDNLTSNANGYNASCSFHVKDTDNKTSIYTGDWGGTSLKGFIWKTEQTAYSDNSTAYEVKFRTPRIALGANPQSPPDPRLYKRFQRLRLVDQNFLNNTALTVNLYIDGIQHQTQYSFTEPAHGFILDTSYLDINSLYASNTEYKEFIADIGNFGNRIEIEVTNNNVANTYFYIASMLLDYRPLAVAP